MVDHINVGAIPGADLDPTMVEISANEMKLIGDDVRTQGGTVLTSWQAIAQHYEAPEAPVLFNVMNPVKTDAETFGTNVDKVHAALNTYAAEVEPIKAKLDSLRTDAQNFVDSIAGGVTQKHYSRAGVTKETVSWDKDQASVDKNNKLIHDVNAQMVLLWAAERKCANAIYDIIGYPHIEAASNDNPNGYGVTDIPDGTKTPWGSAVKRTEGCGEKAADAVGHFVWDGVIKGGIWGTIKGLGTLVLGYNPRTGEWFSGDAYGAAWSNMGMLAFGLATAGPIGIAGSAMPGPVGDFFRKGDQALVNAGKGLIAYDKWKDDPAAAAGEATFNIASIIIPAGAAVSAVKTSSTVAASAIRTAAKVVEFTDPASALVKLGAAGVKVSMPAIANLLKAVDLSKVGFGDLSKIDIDIPDVGKVDVPGSKVDVPGNSVDVPNVGSHDITLNGSGGSAAHDLPGSGGGPGRDVSAPSSHPGSGDGSGGSTSPAPVREPVHVGSGGTDVPAPVREPVHVGSGGTDVPAPVREPVHVGSGTSEVPVPAHEPVPVHASAGTDVHAPVHEPVRVGSGGESSTSTHLGGDASGAGVGTAGHHPVETGGGAASAGHGAGSGGGEFSTPGHGGGDPTTPGHGGDGTGGGPAGPAGGGGGAHPGHPWDPSQGDPVLSDAEHGPGFTRDHGLRGNPVHPTYGQPLPAHGTLNPKYGPPNLAHIPPEVRELVTDPGAPYGRDAAGDPYTKAEWESRYIDTNDQPIYPGNAGAVDGRRLDFTDVDEFQTHYGDVLDRMGGRNGDFLSFPGTAFEERGLPPGNLSSPYLTIRLTGELPPGVHIEVSEVAPAFGQPGGGLQVRLLDSDGQAMTVDQLEKDGIIHVTGDTSRIPPLHDGNGTTPHYRDWSDEVPH